MSRPGKLDADGSGLPVQPGQPAALDKQQADEARGRLSGAGGPIEKIGFRFIIGFSSPRFIYGTYIILSDL